ncbi:hypothetical protein RRG08_044612 [Elysia crispata]|uniref:Uncharacterized protein n=1 Tax=Elysia crispata TaxID=231223 RepID=A0AAE0YML3_9GAST|nr:hypothetical protein RRG08_044612 [Elysia crispata]
MSPSADPELITLPPCFLRSRVNNPPLASLPAFSNPESRDNSPPLPSLPAFSNPELIAIPSLPAFSDPELIALPSHTSLLSRSQIHS